MPLFIIDILLPWWSFLLFIHHLSNFYLFFIAMEKNFHIFAINSCGNNLLTDNKNATLKFNTRFPLFFSFYESEKFPLINCTVNVFLVFASFFCFCSQRNGLLVEFFILNTFSCFFFALFPFSILLGKNCSTLTLTTSSNERILIKMRTDKGQR